MTLLRPPGERRIPAGPHPVVAEWNGRRVGAELEFFVVDRDTCRPVDRLDALLSALEPGEAKPEIAREQVELVSRASTSLEGLEEELRGLVERATAALADVGAILLPMSLLDGDVFTPTDDPRYHRLVDVFGPPFWQNAATIVSDQVNVGAADEGEAFRVLEGMVAHLPLFVGLSAASPFLEGRANGVACNRMRRYDACVVRHPSLVGIPPRLRSMEDYNRELAAQPVSSHPNLFYRYVRPMPHRGVAAEVRCVDKQPTLAGFMAVAALARAVASEALTSDDPYDLDGLEVRLGRARERGVLDPDAWGERLEALSGHLPERERPYLRPLVDRLEHGPPALWLEKAVEARGERRVRAELARGYLAPAGAGAGPP